MLAGIKDVGGKTTEKQSRSLKKKCKGNLSKKRERDLVEGKKRIFHGDANGNSKRKQSGLKKTMRTPIGEGEMQMTQAQGVVLLWGPEGN